MGEPNHVVSTQYCIANSQYSMWPHQRLYRHYRHPERQESAARDEVSKLAAGGILPYVLVT